MLDVDGRTVDGRRVLEVATASGTVIGASSMDVFDIATVYISKSSH